MINPQPFERRTLHAEERAQARGLGPLFLSPFPPYQRVINLGESCWARRENFKVCLRVLDTDMIDMPGIGARLIYWTILPRDEDQYFCNSPVSMDKCEHYLAIVSSSSSTFLIMLVAYLFTFCE